MRTAQRVNKKTAAIRASLRYSRHKTRFPGGGKYSLQADGQTHIFLLQGPVGSFFAHLSRHLRASGFSVLDVCFNLGDRLYRPAPGRVWFKGSPDEWRAELRRLCQLRRPQCFIMFGDRRPVHIAACEVAAELGIKVYSFEEGYLRPHYVTFEPGGNNARSRVLDPLPGFTPREDPPPPRAVGKSFGRMALNTIVYQWALAFGRPFARGYQHHRDRNVLLEALLWTRALWRKWFFAIPETLFESRLISRLNKKFFIVALQVHDDLQGKHHGRKWTQEDLIAAAMRSFARHAPQDAYLVIRYHPMDRGHVTYRPLVRRLAREAGVSGRARLMLTGHGPRMLTHAAGFVTVNSTMALSAMYHNCPVFAFGDCFYRMPGLVAEGSDEAALDAFWQAPPPVDHDLFLRVRALILEHSQINGNFYLPRFFPAMAASVTERLSRDMNVANG